MASFLRSIGREPFWFTDTINGRTFEHEIKRNIENDKNLVRIPGRNGDYPFYIASKYKQYESVTIFMIAEYPTAMSQQESIGIPSIRECKTVKAMNDIYNNFEIRDNVIHRAVKCGSYYLVSYLLQNHGGSYLIKCEDMTDNTALHLACRYRQYDIILLLLEYMKNENITTINDINSEGETALHIFCENKCNSPECLKQILNNPNLNVNIKRKNDGYTPLMCACKESDNGNYNNARELLKIRSLLINETNNEGETALHVACKYANVGIIDCILNRFPLKRNNRACNSGDVNHTTPLLHAIRGFADNDIKTQYNRAEAVKLLIEAGANPCLGDSISRSPLIYLSKIQVKGWCDNNKPAAKKLFDNLFLFKEINLNEYDSNYNTALHCACNNGNVALVKRLILHDDTNVDCNNRHNHTPLMMVVSMKDHKVKEYHGIIKLLIDVGKADKNYKTNGRTVLHQACCLGKYNFVNRLLKYNDINVNAITLSGVPLLFEACNEHNMSGMVLKQLLTRNDIERNVLSVYNKRSVLHYAIIHYNKQAVKILLQSDETINLEKTDYLCNTIFHYAIYECITDRSQEMNNISVDISVEGYETIENRRNIVNDRQVRRDAISILEMIMDKFPHKNLFKDHNERKYCSHDLVTAEREIRDNQDDYVLVVKNMVNEYVIKTRNHMFNWMMTQILINK